jgi:Tfp pilus assembly protein PilN
VQAVLGSFGWDAASGWPVAVLSDGGPSIGRVVASLQAAGLPAEAAVPTAQELRAPPGFGPAEIYEYRVPLGLALTALDEPAGALDLFAHVGTGEQQKAAAGRRSVVLAGALAAGMFLALLLTWYSVDLALARRLKAQVADPDFEAARQHQVLLQTVARHRPDILQLLLDVNAGPGEGVVLDSIHFKKGQAVTVTGQADNEEQMWKYEENLRQQKGVGNVEMSSLPRDPKTRKIKFTATFQYRNFTKKGAAL